VRVFSGPQLGDLVGGDSVSVNKMLGRQAGDIDFAVDECRDAGGDHGWAPTVLVCFSLCVIELFMVNVMKAGLCLEFKRVSGLRMALKSVI